MKFLADKQKNNKKLNRSKEQKAKHKFCTCAHKISACPITEIMEDSIPVILQHLGMNVKARITKFCNLLCQQFHPVNRITKYNRLINLKLEKIKSVSRLYR